MFVNLPTLGLNAQASDVVNTATSYWYLYKLASIWWQVSINRHNYQFTSSVLSISSGTIPFIHSLHFHFYPYRLARYFFFTLYFIIYPLEQVSLYEKRTLTIRRAYFYTLYTNQPPLDLYCHYEAFPTSPHSRLFGPGLWPLCEGE